MDDTISRLTSISQTVGQTTTTLESYDYLGLSTVVRRAHPQPGVDLTYIKQTGEANGDAGDQYTGLDRFDRVVDQRWIVTANGTHTDRFQYGYDRDSNRLYRNNLVNTAFGELYHANGASNGYDNLNQLSGFLRGVLNGGHDTISSPSHSITWSLDPVGNFASTTTDGAGAVANTFNKQNQETAAGSSTLAFDNNGNITTDDQGKTLVNDAWNRFVAYKNGGTTLASYKYDALGRKIIENTGSDKHLYYSDKWQVLEERDSGNVPRGQYVWSPVYVDALIERDRDPNGGGTLSERLYVQQDANWNVTALITTSGSVVERYAYDPYGKQSVLDASWSARSSSSYAFVLGFQGTRLDTVTGNNYFRNREYSVSLGRFLQNDPIKYRAGDPNLYRFVFNSPTNATDPTGLYLVVGEDQKGKPVELFFGKDNVEYEPIPGKPGWFKVKLKDGAALHLEKYVKDEGDKVKAYAAWLFTQAYSDSEGLTLKELAKKWSEIIKDRPPRPMTPEQASVYYKKFRAEHPYGEGVLRAEKPSKRLPKWEELTPEDKGRYMLLIYGKLLSLPVTK